MNKIVKLKRFSMITTLYYNKKKKINTKRVSLNRVLTSKNILYYTD